MTTLREDLGEVQVFLLRRAHTHKVRRPQLLCASLSVYLVTGQTTPGSFLSYVLDNKLKETVLSADDVNKDQLREIVSWLRDSIPAVAWNREEWVKLEDRQEQMLRFIQLENRR